MKHKLVLVVISLSVITLLSGCATHSTISSLPQDTSTPVSSPSTTETVSLSPTPPPQSTTPSLNTTEILSPVIAAMRQVSSAKIDTNIIEQYSIQGPSEDVHTTYIWDGQRAVDIHNDQMHLTMNIDMFNDGFYEGTKTNVYYDNETTYGQYWRSGAINPQGGWYQSKLIAEEEYSTAKDQLTPVIGLLENADYVTYKTTGKLDGPDYRVIQFTPAAAAAADWVLSQRFMGGPSFLTAAGITIVGKAAFTSAFKGGIFQIWVDSETNLITKAYFAPVFQATRDELNKIYGYPPSNQEATYERDFTAQLSFSGYNQPVNVQPDLRP